jgi:hypothetical protein
MGSAPGQRTQSLPIDPKRAGDIKVLIGATIAVLLLGFFIAGAAIVTTRGGGGSECGQHNIGLATDIRNNWNGVRTCRPAAEARSGRADNGNIVAHGDPTVGHRQAEAGSLGMRRAHGPGFIARSTR